MGCSNEDVLAHVTFSCADKPKGGIQEIYVVRKADIDMEDIGNTDIDGALTIATVTAASVAMIDFNKKDGFTYAGTDLSSEADGTDSYTPTVAIEIPRVTLDKLQAVTAMVGGFNELLVVVKARTGIITAYGQDSGVYVSTATTTTGTNTEKNMMQITFTGDEDSFERIVDDASLDVLKAALVV